jgi:predicted enzyme related to lactoylglutathione lyase
MSKRDGFQPGVPAWVDTWQPDARAATAFYSRIFGWETVDAAPGRYVMCRMRDADVAGIGAQEPDAPLPATAWTTYVWVEDVDETVANATAAGGTVVMDPFDSLEGGRIAILADPEGAILAAWQPGEHRGAERVNEPGAWSMSVLLTDDRETARAFYGAVFGWEVEDFGPIALWRLPGFVGGEPQQPVPRDVVALMAPLPSKDVAPQWGVNFWVDDADAVAATTTELGGSILAAPWDSDLSRNASLADPQGAVFSVSQMRHLA